VSHDLPQPTFIYFGWTSLEDRLRAQDAPELKLEPQWYTEFDGLKRHQNPQRIAIELGGTRAVFFVPERADVSLQRYVRSE